MKGKDYPEKTWPPLSKRDSADHPIPEKVYPVIDTDLARDNVENDLPAADREDL